MRHSRSRPLNANCIGKFGSEPWIDHIIRAFTIGNRLGSIPSVDLVPVESASTYGGRYFPKYNAILIYHNPDHELNRGVVVHELSHWKTYCTVCGDHKGGSQCGYRGDHDDTFYQTVAPMYRSLGVTPDIIKIVEVGYRYPRSLLR